MWLAAYVNSHKRLRQSDLKAYAKSMSLIAAFRSPRLSQWILVILFTVVAAACVPVSANDSILWVVEFHGPKDLSAVALCAPSAGTYIEGEGTKHCAEILEISEGNGATILRAKYLAPIEKGFWSPSGDSFFFRVEGGVHRYDHTESSILPMQYESISMFNCPKQPLLDAGVYFVAQERKYYKLGGRYYVAKLLAEDLTEIGILGHYSVGQDREIGSFDLPECETLGETD